MVRFLRNALADRPRLPLAYISGCLLLLAGLAPTLHAQNTVFSQQFVNGVTPTTQITAWGVFCTQLQPGLYMKMTISGTYDPVGITCTDAVITNAFAAAVKSNGTIAYTSPSTGGHVWSICNRYNGEVWLDPPAQCSGSNCPSPAYIIRVGVGNLNWGGINTPTCTSNPTQTMTLTFFRPSSPNDAGISAVLSPLNFCPGTYPVQVQLENFGTQQITAATINWTFNGAPQTPYSWTGLLDTLNSTTRKTSVTLLGSYNFLPNVPYTIRAWTTNPNGIPDTVNANDTSNVTRQTALSGTYTIGGASPSFANFTAAVNALNNSGVCGPAVFNVRSGTYTEQISLNAISGASATNTVTFQSETGVRTDVVLTYSTPTTTMGTVIMNGADYVTFKNMTIANTGTTYAQTLIFQSGSDYNTFNNDIIRSTIGAYTSTNNAVIFSSSGTDSFNQFIGNSIEGGGYGAYWYGSSTTAWKVGTIWQGNTFLNWYYMGIYTYYQQDMKFRDNVVTTNSAYTTNYGTYFYYSDYGALEITGNKILMTSGAGSKYNYLYGSSTSQATRRLVANNFFASNGGASACYNYHYYMYNTDYYHNTWYINSTATGYCAYIYYGGDIKYVDNIFYSNGPSYVVYGYDSVTPQANVVQMDWNLYYTTGSVFAYWNSGQAQATYGAFVAATGKNANSKNKAISFVNANAGDLHLAGASQNDQTLNGLLLAAVTQDIDKEPRNLPYVGADEGCFILPNTVTASLVDGNGNPTTYVQYPGTVYLNYNIAFPTTGSWTVATTLNFYSIPSQTLAYTYTFNLNKLSGIPLVGSQAVPIPALNSGYYRVETIFNTQNSCNLFINYKPGDLGLLAVPFGTTPCVVWPGDVNNDGLVNFEDRKDLNTYIHDANLSPIWLTGPARYRADAATNPMTYYTWEGQAAAPWATPMGCYMDADGNGVINSFDYLPQRVNFLKTHGPVAPKQGNASSTITFDMLQNYPNPFTASAGSTTIQYSVPERSQVRLTVHDLLGREVARLVDGTVDAGVSLASFDASNLVSGRYIATVVMTGIESGLSFSKTITMTLDK